MVTDNFLFVLGIANCSQSRHETNTDWTRCLRAIPAQVRPWHRCGSMDGEARPALAQESCRAGSTPRRTSHPTPCGIILGGTPERHGEHKGRGNWNPWGYSGMDGQQLRRRRVSDWPREACCGLNLWSKPPEPHGNGSPQAHPHGVWLGKTQSDGKAWGCDGA